MQAKGSIRRNETSLPAGDWLPARCITQRSGEFKHFSAQMCKKYANLHKASEIIPHIGVFG